MRLGSYGFETENMLVDGVINKQYKDDRTPNNQRFLQYEFEVDEIPDNETVFSFPIVHGDVEEW